MARKETPRKATKCIVRIDLLPFMVKILNVVDQHPVSCDEGP